MSRLYLALGDSITAKNQEAGATKDDLYVKMIANKIKNDYGHIKFINKAISGYKSGDIINNSYFQLRFKPDIVTILIGTNDCYNAINLNTFKVNLTAIINKLRIKNPNVAITLITPPNNKDADNLNLQDYRDAMALVAIQNNTNICDLSLAWSILQSNTYTVDGLHPNTLGYTVIYNILWESIKPLIDTLYDK